jgi:hypothetical protein
MHQKLSYSFLLGFINNVDPVTGKNAFRYFENGSHCYKVGLALMFFVIPTNSMELSHISECNN